MAPDGGESWCVEMEADEQERNSESCATKRLKRAPFSGRGR